MNKIDNSTILITGGTGSLGRKLSEILITQHKPRKVIVLSRNEEKQVDMERSLADPYQRMRYFIGDIRDRERLYQAFQGVDVIIHCAALKHVDKCYYNPSEVVKTNIYGAENIISIALRCSVKQVLAVSTDKAVNPINLYGAAKLCSDFLFIGANVYSGQSETRFSVIRSGNFWGSSGSVVSYFRDLKAKGVRTVPVTDLSMTRFFVTLEGISKYIIRCVTVMTGGEIFSPHMASMRLDDLIEQIYPEAEIKIVGRRPGEKMHEEIMSTNGAVVRSDKCCVRSFST